MHPDSLKLERRWYKAYGLSGSVEKDPNLLEDFREALLSDPIGYLSICRSLLSRDDYKRFLIWVAVHLFEDFVFHCPQSISKLVDLCKRDARAFEALEFMYYDEDETDDYVQELADLIANSRNQVSERQID